MNALELLNLVQKAPAPALVTWTEGDRWVCQANAALAAWPAVQGWTSTQWEALVPAWRDEVARGERTGRQASPALQWEAVVQPQAVLFWLTPEAAPAPAPAPAPIAPVERPLRDLPSAERIAQTFGFGVWRVDLPDLSVTADAPCLQLMGLEELGALPSFPIERLRAQLHPEDVRTSMTATERALQPGVGIVTTHARFRQADGSFRRVMTRRVALRNPAGQPTSLIGVSVDVTRHLPGRDRAELLDDVGGLGGRISGVGVWMAQQAEPRHCWDDQMYRMIGLDAADPRPVEQIREACILPEDLSRLDAYCVSLLAELSALPDLVEMIGDSVEFRARHADGSTRWLRARAMARRATDGSTLLIGAQWDVSEQQRLEQIRREHEAAEQANRFKSRFLANMSHEIRTPMNAIIGMANLALETRLDARQQNFVIKMLRAAQSLQGLLDDILEFSRIESGKTEGEQLTFTIDEIMHRLSDRIGSQADEKGLELLFETSQNLPLHLVGDPARLLRVLVNLCANAVKFSDRGEVLVKILLVDRYPERRSVRLRFEVHDSGVGISEENLQRLFLPFEQEDSSTSRRFGGTGLGLAISKQLVKLMGGELSAYSAVGQGSAFLFDLEFALSPDEPMEEDAETLPGNPRVLVVDDNALARQVLVNMAQNIGLEADQASNGPMALEEVRRASGSERPYVSVIIDWRMPIMDGVEVARRLLDLDLPHRPSLLMMTAFGHQQLAAALAAARISASAVLSKPLTPSALYDALSDVLEHHRRSSVGARHRAESLQGWKDLVKGRRILLAEDNPLNQELALELLRGAGAIVTLVENGQQAIDAVARHRFDLVLMDCQMPVIDGYQACTVIRATESGRYLPIIAMTANAMPSDRALSLSVGMNDHIAKPLDVSQMFESMARWLTPRDDDAAAPPGGAQPGDQSATAGVPTASVADEGAVRHRLEELPGIDVAIGRRSTMDDDRLYSRLLQLFLRQNQDFAMTFRAALTGGDFVGARRLAHDLSSGAGAIGAVEVQRAASALEAACASGAEMRTLQVLLLAALRDLSPVIDGLRRFDPGEG